MPVKDRLTSLKATAADRNDPDVVPKGEVKIEMSVQGSLDKFFEEVELMNTQLDSIEKNIALVKQKHNLILSSPASDERDKNELERLMEQIKNTAGNLRTHLKNLESSIEREEQTGAITADLRIRKTQHATLTRRFTTVMSDYNKAQTDYKERCKTRIKRQLEITGRPTADDQIDEMLESGDPQIFTQGIVAESQQAKQALADVEARHQDIIKLESNIKELRDMFVDMAMLVEAQGEMIDRIEHNVVNAAEYVAQAKVETKKAVEYQSSARRKKICLIVTGIVVLIIIILAIAIPLAEKYGGSSSSSSNNRNGGSTGGGETININQPQPKVHIVASPAHNSTNSTIQG